jgi:DNA-binding response OmpR family regulator
MARILIIDDDRELCELLRDRLAQDGFTLDAVHQPKEGIHRALSGRFDIVILDVMLPDVNGFEVLRRIRSSSRIPVLMLTARGDDIDRIVGLEMGADDYLPKPFNPRELVARIQAILRRTEQQEPPKPAGILEVGDLVLNPGMRKVVCGGQAVELTSIEFSILEVLLAVAGQVVSREELVRKALGRGYSAYDRSVDVHISSLRRKLGEMERIKTIRNVGYLYALAGEPAHDE